MTESELIAEQLRHTVAMLRADLKTLSNEQAHQRELYEHRIKELEDCGTDHETRIRSLQDGVTSYRTKSGIANGGALFMSLMAFIRTFQF
jgi:hypothetical protein